MSEPETPETPGSDQTRLIVGPFNRVEGDLEVRLDVADGQVRAAYVNSPLYRGFERMLIGKAPEDALTLTPRICGICSISQSAAAALALAEASGTTPTPDGARTAALLHAVENLCDHLTHFHMFFMADFTRPEYETRAWFATVAERFAPGGGAAVRRALAARAALLHIVGLLGGKWPHTLAIQPAGVTRAPSLRDKVRMAATLRAFRRYLEEVLFGAPLEAFAEIGRVDALMGWRTGDAGLFLRLAGDLGLDSLGPGPGRYMSFGAYPGPDGPLMARGLRYGAGPVQPVETGDIVEDLSHAWMLGAAAHPTAGQTLPDEAMADPGYTWCKAPRLAGQTVETGAFARQVVDGHPLALDLARGGSSVLARVAGRLLEIAHTQILMETLLAEIRPEERFMGSHQTAADGTGAGLVEAARGALGHWVRIEAGKIANYQIIAPTTWNFSPRDAGGQPGPLEAALVGAPVPDGAHSPVAVQHIVRSFDPCMVCTVH